MFLSFLNVPPVCFGSSPDCVCAAVWDQILEPVAQMRSSSGTLKLFPAYLKGEDLFGLTTSAVSRIIESVRGHASQTLSTAPQLVLVCGSSLS